MKINPLLINNIFKLNIKILNKKDKIKLSKYQEIIPLYDIYSHLVYPINFNQIEDYILNKHYRFITVPQKQIFKNYLVKLDTIKSYTIEEKEFIEKMNYNLKVIDNYDLETLEETSVKAFYYGSTNLGQSISICRRKSFNPLLKHLTPYYSLNELIKMGQNMGMIKKKITPIELQNENLHYQICKEISKNDIYAKEILTHQNYLEKYYNEITFFSIYGSYFINQNLRYYQENNTFINCPFPYYLEYTKTVTNIFNNSPGLEEEYYLYRFIQNDHFLRNIKKGDVFIEAGIMSTTRNSFYSSDELEHFGLILLKITVPKQYNKILLIEGLSVFPHEEEIIFSPFTKLQLISQDNDFEYYHTNEKIQKSIKKRYHFKVIGQDIFPSIPKISLNKIPILNINSKLFSPNMTDRKREFMATLSNKGLLNIKLPNKTILFMSMFFDSTEAYQRVYFNRDTNGILLFCFNEHSMKYSIEISHELVFNFQDKFFPGSLDLTDDDIYYLICIIGKLFGYTTAKVYLPYIKKNNLIYPLILDTETSFKNFNLKSGFSNRDFITKFNSNVNITNHPYDKFNIKINTWKKYFEISKKNKSLDEFYQNWENHFNENLITNLYSLVDLTNFYQEHNIDIEKINLNKNVSEINRFRQRS
ncbi:hypothetical protein crov495 [Cafeteria roenbergensis virus]|uniref:Uncharacterized protein n=1 Tax=Cafeteria roenbergensis virus (strain BV-PW1) TaxID=693272 RepID=E3T5R6_CROVB|nr:hypothetical protein crov495 [Cafeteria roenbergensis virus BV-PW1]ADO67529.1 hypothetical protein crov495 [Cafeteria roenbergensis virus BV-PW1]